MSSINYEIATVEKMVHIYCASKHGSPKGELCNACKEMNDYARLRLTKCPFGDEKGACADCKIHCYSPQMREYMRSIMRYSGPRMLIYHPVDFIIHIFKDRKKK